MTDFLRIVYEGVIDFSPNEMMGALMIGLVLSLGCHGICILGRKRATNPLPLLCGLIFVVSVVSMAIGFGHSRSRSVRRYEAIARMRREAGPTVGSGGFSKSVEPIRRSRERSEFNQLGRTLLSLADLDKDGNLTPEEAAQFIKVADQDGNGSVGASEIDRAQSVPSILPFLKRIPPAGVSPE